MFVTFGFLCVLQSADRRGEERARARSPDRPIWFPGKHQTDSNRVSRLLPSLCTFSSQRFRNVKERVDWHNARDCGRAAVAAAAVVARWPFLICHQIRKNEKKKPSSSSVIGFSLCGYGVFFQQQQQQQHQRVVVVLCRPMRLSTTTVPHRPHRVRVSSCCCNCRLNEDYALRQVTGERRLPVRAVVVAIAVRRESVPTLCLLFSQ